MESSDTAGCWDHDPVDLTAARDTIVAVLEDVCGGVSPEGIDWLTRSEAVDHWRLLMHWDDGECPEAAAAWATRNPAAALRYMEQVRRVEPERVADRPPSERLSFTLTRARYWYGFDVFDAVLTGMASDAGPA